MPIPEEIANASMSPLDTSKVDPKDVLAFLDVKRAETENESDAEPAQPGDAPAEPAVQSVAIPPNDDFSVMPGQDQMIEQSLNNVDARKIEVTPEEKEAFLKSVLMDEPFRTTVSLYGGRFKLDIRSRSIHEQRRVFDLASLSGTEPDAPDKDKEPHLLAALNVTRHQQYCAALMVERINGVLFSEMSLERGTTLADDHKKMFAFVQAKLEDGQQTRWQAILTAMRIFECKCAQMSSDAQNENF